jgi:hypothetical protein
VERGGSCPLHDVHPRDDPSSDLRPSSLLQFQLQTPDYGEVSEAIAPEPALVLLTHPAYEIPEYGFWFANAAMALSPPVDAEGFLTCCAVKVEET